MVESVWRVTTDVNCKLVKSWESKNETSSVFGVFTRDVDGIFIFCLSHAWDLGKSGNSLEGRLITLFLFQGAVVVNTGH